MRAPTASPSTSGIDHLRGTGAHVPDEPTTLAEDWLAAVLDGRDLESVLTFEGDGVTAWLWTGGARSPRPG